MGAVQLNFPWEASWGGHSLGQYSSHGPGGWKRLVMRSVPWVADTETSEKSF